MTRDRPGDKRGQSAGGSTPSAFVERLRCARASAILRTDDTETARWAMEAAVRGGFEVIEFTLTIPGAYDLIAEFAQRGGLVVGAGTVLSVEQARQAVAAGARFLVSPVTDPTVIAEAATLGVAAMPGAHTPTEMLTAHRAGAPLVKLFPQPGDAPTVVRQIMGPMPFLKIVPTAGVDEHNAAALLAAGAWALGFVSSLFAAEDLEAGRAEAIETRARRLLAAVDR